MVFQSIWVSLERQTQKTILIVSPVVILGFIALLDIHPLLTVGCTLLTALYGVIFFIVELVREFINKLKGNFK
jgi:hypothetical protein